MEWVYNQEKCKECVKMVQRVNISLEDGILKRLDDEAKRVGISRSAFVAVAINNYFVQQDNVAAVNQLAAMLEKLESKESKS